MIKTAHQTLVSFQCLVLAAVVTLLFLNGCGMSKSMSMGTSNAITSFAFVANSGSGTVSAFAVNSGGGLSAVSGSPFPSGSGAEFMALDRVHKFLFVTNRGANNVSAFSVNTGTGMLTAVPSSPFPAGGAPLGVAADPMGRFVFVANQNDSTVSAFSIDAMTGALTPVPGSPFAGVTNPFGVTVSPTGAFLFVSSFNLNNGTGNTVTTFSINGTTGALTPAGSSFPTSNPPGITAPIGLATDGRFLFVGNHMAESVVSFNINSSNGALSAVSALPAPAPACAVSCHNNPLRLAVDPMDKFVFWTNVQAGTLVSFNINNGNLSFVTSASTGQHPFGLAFDPGGNFLFVVNKVDNSISAFSVNSSTGTVSPVQGSPFAEGGNAPTDIVIVAKQ